MNKGSSETIREILDEDFIFWFIGFFEGDGSFIINGNGYLEFKITQTSSDAQVLFLIKKRIGFGQVRCQDKKNKTHHYRVRDQVGLGKLIEIFNGRILLSKRYLKFVEWVRAYNKVYSMNIAIKPYNPVVTLNNSWLCGFTDAEGCFNISLVARNPIYTQVFVRFMLSQQSESEILGRFCILLEGNLNYLPSYGGFNLVINLNKLDKVIQYFKKYKLRTKKFINFIRWLRIYNLVKKQEHLKINGLEKIKKIIALKSPINQNDKESLIKIESDQLRE